MAKEYKEHPFPILTKEEYIDIVVSQLELLPPEIIIQRLTGDGVKDKLIAPDWTLKKVVVLNASGSDISDAVGELSSSADDNAQTASDTMGVVNDMNATMQQVQSSSEELMTTAAELQETLGRFRM